VAATVVAVVVVSTKPTARGKMKNIRSALYVTDDFALFSALRSPKSRDGQMRKRIEKPK